MESHPLAEVWPLMTGEKLDKLIADIKENGLLLPIIIYKGKILDGRNRYNACAEAGVAPRYEVSKAKNDEEALILSISLNEHRRHMSQDQLAFVAAKLSNIKHGGSLTKGKPRSKFANANFNQEKVEITTEKAAEAVGVSRPAVLDARVIREEAPELEEAVTSNKISLRNAANTARERKKDKVTAKKTEAKPKKKTVAEVLSNRKVVPSRNLTKHDVDPEFVGGHAEFITEYGHIWLKTSKERSRDYFQQWAICVRYLGKVLKEQATPKVTPAVLRCLTDPRQADIDMMEASLIELENAIGKARSLLDQAKSAKAVKTAA